MGQGRSWPALLIFLKTSALTLVRWEAIFSGSLWLLCWEETVSLSSRCNGWLKSLTRHSSYEKQGSLLCYLSWEWNPRTVSGWEGPYGICFSNRTAPNSVFLSTPPPHPSLLEMSPIPETFGGTGGIHLFITLPLQQVTSHPAFQLPTFRGSHLLGYSLCPCNFILFLSLFSFGRDLRGTKKCMLTLPF